ncbi:MAG: hypothetical protein ACJ78K_03895 [Gemmatimonadaceae bacterium]
MAVSLARLHTTANESHALPELRLLCQLYEEAQRARIAHGERLRAIFQGRSFTDVVISDDPDDLLKAIARGESAGAPPILEHAYARAIEEELEAAAALRESIERHPAWGWLDGVKGVGHLLAARLLSRLDITRARTPSAFWAYCGLGTIPGVAYRCERCGLEIAYPVGYQPQETHQTRSGARACPGTLKQVIGEKAARVAPRRSSLGGRAGYDAQARSCCYLIGVSMMRCGSEYRSFYDAERARLATVHEGWTAKRCHLAALRKMEKAFLRDLWIAWRTAENLPVVASYYPRIQ